ncbi:MAG TPA: DUF1499 domain-containing protein [Candidatus Manganitrophaceae bacterium]|nr:DUF1499 domain-containing protein [Candidatus Manganitrophaceae bacterium]
MAADLKEARRPSGFVSAARLGFALAILSLALAAGSGLGTRFGFWDFRTGFTILKWGAYSAIGAAAVSFIALLGLRRRGLPGAFALAAVGLLLGLIILSVPLQWMRTAKRVPPIHDITTDTENPPPFVKVLSRRKEAANPAEYGGPEVAAQQKAGYPDLGPITVSLPPDQAFNHALAAAAEMGWELVDASLTDGRIEATDTTFWFGFKDDIVIRITPVSGGSRVDVRSVSRVGKSDVGTNARRIQTFLARLKERA